MPKLFFKSCQGREFDSACFVRDGIGEKLNDGCHEFQCRCIWRWSFYPIVLAACLPSTPNFGSLSLSNRITPFLWLLLLIAAGVDERSLYLWKNFFHKVNFVPWKSGNHFCANTVTDWQRNFEKQRNCCLWFWWRQKLHNTEVDEVQVLGNTDEQVF